MKVDTDKQSICGWFGHTTEHFDIKYWNEYKLYQCYRCQETMFIDSFLDLALYELNKHSHGS